MAKQDYMPTTDEGKATLFENFRDNIGGYLDVLGFHTAAGDPIAEIVQQAEDAVFCRFVLNQTKVMQQCGQQWTAYKNEVFSMTAGANHGEALEKPVLPVEPQDAPSPVPPGIEDRFRALARRAKAQPGYNVNIGEVLGIEGAERDGPDLNTVAPNLKLRTRGGRVEVVWNKQGMDAIELMVDRGDGFGFAGVDLQPNYVDETPLPAVPETWRYRGMYRKGGDRVGQWSPVVSIAVGLEA